MAGKINKELVSESKHFCMLPWNHLHFWPDNSVFPCCVANSSMPIGKYSGDIEKLYNSEKLNTIRKNMLADQPSVECNRCYELEKNKIQSLRITANKKYINFFDEVTATNSDGSVNQFKMRYLDVRFSNLCNFRCRSCGPGLSSSWADDQKKMFPGWDEKKLHRIEPAENFWNDILPSLTHIVEAYFAGGEPLITDEIYRVMDYWIENKILDINIGFTTNFSQLSFKGKNILDYWKKFPKTIVSASLDDSYERGEYLRKGTNWMRIVQNRKQMLVEASEIKFEITPTISVFNVWHFPEFHYEWLSEGLLKTEDIRLNILTQPSSMSVLIIDKVKRAMIIEKWNQYLDKILKNIKDEHGFDLSRSKYNKTVEAYESVITLLQSDDQLHEKNEFFERNNLLDKVREEHLFKVYPELKYFLNMPDSDPGPV